MPNLSRRTSLKKIVAYADENYRQVMFGGETKVAGSLTIRLSQSPVMQRYLRFVPKKFPVGVLKNCCSDSVQIEMPNGISLWIFCGNQFISALC